ncbi:MAG: glycosyltransferase family 2 protein [Oscillospiraceae bacterium]|nr:glycosyltransferase family 2 protein [Oscillospiraceae bacterium]
MPSAVTATIVTYMGYEKAREAIASLLKYTKRVPLKIYVVDNASGDGTAERLRADFGSITVIENSRNNGFGYGHNTVIPLLEDDASDYHLIVNPDILIEDDVVGELAGYLDSNSDVGIVTPKILNLDGTDQSLPKRQPAVTALIGRRIFRKTLKKQVEHYQMKDCDLSEATAIEFATGCFFMIRTKLFIDLAGFDTRFFLYYEDIDLSKRVKETMKVIYYPYAAVYHAWERSSAHKVKYFLILVQGMFKYFGKWGWKIRYKLPK